MVGLAGRIGGVYGTVTGRPQPLISRHTIVPNAPKSRRGVARVYGETVSALRCLRPCRFATLLALCACGSSPSPSPQAAPLETSSPDSTPVDRPVPKGATAPASTCEPLTVELPPLIETPINPTVPDIEDPSGALNPLFERLGRLLRGTADDHVRFAMYGDSNMTKDFITGELRRVLQKAYGDGGHGYLAGGQPWSWYKHMDVEQWIEPRGWRSYAVSTHSVPDHAYGVAGIAGESTSINARLRFATASAGAPVGTRVSRVQIHYLMRPKGSPFEVHVDGTERATISTESDELSAGMQTIEVDDGAHAIELKAGGPNVRVFGVALERSDPGIVVDSLGVGGATIAILDRMHARVTREALRHRKYDLVMLLTGGTEDDNEAHDAALTSFIHRLRDALPNVPVLIMSPIDFAYGGRSHPKPARRIARLADRKRRIALANGCAYWDFHGAMGGELSIVTFASHRLAWNDLVHLTESGGAFMGRRIAYAIWSSFRRYSEANPRIGCGANG